MKKLIIIALFPVMAHAQTKDTLISKRDLQTVIRNQQLIQLQLHKIDMSSRLRDALDSVYFVNLAILTRRDTVKKPHPIKK